MTDQISDFIIKKLDTIEEKLDIFTKDFTNFQNSTNNKFTDIEHTLEKQEIRIKNIEDHIGRSWKDRVFEFFTSGVVISVGACLGISLFTMLIANLGGNVASVIKSLFVNIFGI